MSIQGVNMAILEFLGLDAEADEIAAITISAAADIVPRVTITSNVIDENELTKVNQRFELVLIEDEIPEDDDETEPPVPNWWKRRSDG